MTISEYSPKPNNILQNTLKKFRSLEKTAFIAHPQIFYLVFEKMNLKYIIKKWIRLSEPQTGKESSI